MHWICWQKEKVDRHWYRLKSWSCYYSSCCRCKKNELQVSKPTLVAVVVLVSCFLWALFASLAERSAKLNGQLRCYLCSKSKRNRRETEPGVPAIGKKRLVRWHRKRASSMMFGPTRSTTALNREHFVQYPCHFGAAFEQVALFADFQLSLALFQRVVLDTARTALWIDSKTNSLPCARRRCST